MALNLVSLWVGLEHHRGPQIETRLILYKVNRLHFVLSLQPWDCAFKVRRRYNSIHLEVGQELTESDSGLSVQVREPT